MPIDASIYDRLIQPVKQPDSFADIVTASANMKNAQALAEDRRMLVQDKIRQAQEDGQVRQVMSDPNTDMPTKIQHLYTINPKVAGDVEKTYIANQKTQVDLTDLINNHAASNLALYDPKDPSSWGHVQAAQTALYKLVNLPVPAQYQGPPPTPEEVDKWRQTSLTVQQQNEAAKKHLEKDTFGMPGPNGQTSTVLGAFDPSTGQRFVAGPDGQLTPAIGATAKEADDKVQSAEIEAIKAFTAANGRKPTEAELDGIHKRFKEAGTVVRVSTGGAGGSMETPTLKPGTALYRTAQDLAYGKLTFSQLRSLMSYNRNSGQKIALYDMARQLNPQFNPALFEMGYKFAGNPKTQNTLVSIDNALSNFDKAVEVSDALDRTDLPSINRLLASGKFQFGSKPVTNFQQLQTILGDDIALAIGQGAPSDYKTKLAQSLLNGNLSKENFISTLRQAGEFLQNRKQSILKQEGIYGTPEFNPSAAAVVPKVMGGSTAPAYQVGQVVTVKGQKVKITNVLPNGQFQGLPVQ